MSNLLIKGGTVVDGTGAPAYKADVRVKDGVIAEIGADLRPDGEKVYFADDCYVTPGFVESHTHYDATMWWQPDLDPLPGYGVTSSRTFPKVRSSRTCRGTGKSGRNTRPRC